MRLPLIPPAQLTPEQRGLYDDMREDIEAHFGGFATIDEDGALMGPWNPWLHEPASGKPVWDLTKALSRKPTLPPAVREVTILVAGAHFRAAYELYAQVIVAEDRGLNDETLATAAAGQRPADLAREESVAYDVAAALVNDGVLPNLACCRT